MVILPSHDCGDDEPRHPTLIFDAKLARAINADFDERPRTADRTCAHNRARIDRLFLLSIHTANGNPTAEFQDSRYTKSLYRQRVGSSSQLHILHAAVDFIGGGINKDRIPAR